MNGKSDNRTHSALLSLFDFGKLYARTSCEIKHQSGETPTQSSIQYRHTITPPSALVPPCADVRGVSYASRHWRPAAFPIPARFSLATPTPLSVQGARAGQSELATIGWPASPFTDCLHEPGDLPQTGSPDSPGVSRLGDTSGAL